MMKLADEKLLLMDEHRKWFFEIDSTPGEDAMKTVKITAKDLEYYINLVDKAEAGFENIDSNFERNSTVGRMLKTALCATEKLFMKESIKVASIIIFYYFKKFP